MKVRVFVLALFLAAGLGWFAAAVAHSEEQPGAAPGEERAFRPTDSEALIAACETAAVEPAESSAADEEREKKIAYIKCLREAIIDQHSALMAIHLSFAEREGADMEEERSYWRGRAEWLADETRSCIPSCQPAERAERYLFNRAADVGESVLRDFVAERNVYEDGARRFSERDDGSNLGPACWDISDNMRETDNITMLRWGIARTIGCIEYVLLDQVEVVFKPRFLSRRDMRRKIDEISEGYQTFYWSLYNEHRGCFCEATFNTHHLRAYQPVEKGVIDRVSRHGEAYRGEGGFAILRDDEDDLNDQDGSSGRNKHEQGANSARHGLLRGAGADELAHQQR